MIVRVYGTELRFFKSEGWDMLELADLVIEGNLKATRRGEDEYYHLAPTRGWFDYDKLKRIVTRVITLDGRVAGPVESNNYLKYCSQVGVFNWGER